MSRLITRYLAREQSAILPGYDHSAEDVCIALYHVPTIRLRAHPLPLLVRPPAVSHRFAVSVCRRRTPPTRRDVQIWPGRKLCTRRRAPWTPSTRTPSTTTPFCSTAASSSRRSVSAMTPPLFHVNIPARTYVRSIFFSLTLLTLLPGWDKECASHTLLLMVLYHRYSWRCASVNRSSLQEQELFTMLSLHSPFDSLLLIA